MHLFKSTSSDLVTVSIDFGQRFGSYRSFVCLAAVCLVITLAEGRSPRNGTGASALARAPLYPARANFDLNALIDGLQRKYSRINGIAADFVQLYRGADGRSMRESGRLLLKRPGKARWEYLSPERKLFVSDGKNVFFYVEGEKHATRSSVRESADPQIPFLFLLGRGNLRRDFSRIELITDESPVSAGNQVLRLIPKRAPDAFKQLLVEVAPSSFEVRRLVIFERGGARMDFVLNNVRENYVASDAEFRFVPPGGVTIQQAR